MPASCMPPPSLGREIVQGTYVYIRDLIWKVQTHTGNPKDNLISNIAL